MPFSWGEQPPDDVDERLKDWLTRFTTQVSMAFKSSDFQVIEERLILRGNSFVDQEPPGLDILTLISYGPQQDVVELTLDADGTMTFKKEGQYRINVFLQYGRRGASNLASWLFYRGLVNGVASGFTIFTKLDNPNADLPVQIEIFGRFEVGDVFTSEFYRDSQGADAGGLHTETPIIVGFAPPASAGIVITELVHQFR